MPEIRSQLTTEVDSKEFTILEVEVDSVSRKTAEARGRLYTRRQYPFNLSVIRVLDSEKNLSGAGRMISREGYVVTVAVEAE